MTHRSISIVLLCIFNSGFQAVNIDFLFLNCSFYLQCTYCVLFALFCTSLEERKRQPTLTSKYSQMRLVTHLPLCHSHYCLCHVSCLPPVSLVHLEPSALVASTAFLIGPSHHSGSTNTDTQIHAQSCGGVDLHFLPPSVQKSKSRCCLPVN